MKLTRPLTDDILDSIGEGLFTVDKSFKINYFNAAAERITGLSRDEVLGRFCKHVFKSQLCFTNCPIAQVLEQNQGIYDRETRIPVKNDKSVPIRLNASVLRNDDGEPIGGVISFRDISEMELIRTKLSRQSKYQNLIGYSKAMREIFELIEEIADTDATVLIQGESGTGKEMVANAIQNINHRKNKPFIKVNCSVFSPQLLASELFGHVKGAFTGAIKDRPGRFEVADKGTLFLDEVAEMPLEMQLQLLRVLQEGTFERVGESVTRKVDVRVIAATNKNLKQAMAAGDFREDLFYRLNVIPISIPPLKERIEEIPHFVKYFIEKYNIVYKKNIVDIDDQALDLLLHYHWPGNVRELENAIEYAFARTKESTQIEACKLPPFVREGMECVETQHINPNGHDPELIRLLEKHRWNKSLVAKELGIGRSTLWRRLKRLKVA
ncbi:sigma 54-interacting transcriptional regulator [candidate division KSB1 bacterium]|nr:sigma 54-interacting transcriptional regulator [candidate division KSB1 bacterium]